MAAAVSLSATLLIAPQLLGGVTGWATAAIAWMSAATAVLCWWAFRDEPRGGRAAPIVLLVALALVWTAFQALPLPCGAVALIAPESANAFTQMQQVLRTSTWCTLSLDPGSTRTEVVKLAAAGGCLLAGWLMASAGRRRWVVSSAALSTVLMAVVALAHGAMDAEAVFGLYRPRHPNTRLLAPLMNENNLAGFLAMGVPLLLGLGVAERRPSVRALWLMGAAVVGATGLLTLSRGGIAAMLAGCALTVVLLASRGRRTSSGIASGILAVGLTAAAAVGLGSYVAGGAVLSEFQRGTTQKLAIIAEATSMLWAQPWTGVGRGAFSAGFVGEMGSMRRFVYPENILLQWASEWGLPFTVLWIGGLTWALWRAWKLARSSSTVGAIGALLTIGLQNLVDFSLELTGVAVVAAAVLGAVAAPRRSLGRLSAAHAIKKGGRSTALSQLKPVPILVGAIVATAVLLGSTVPSLPVYAREDALKEHLRSGDREAFAAALERALRLHPAEPSFALLAAAEATRHGDLSAGRWLSWSMVLAPHWASPHVQASRWLRPLGRRDQALLEVREAAERDVRMAVAELCQWKALRSEEVLQAAPEQPPHRARFVESLAQCPHLPAETTAELDQWLVKHAPQTLEPRLRRARRALRKDGPAQALEELSEVPAPYAADARVLELAARAHSQAGTHAKAKAVLERIVSSPEVPRLQQIHALQGLARAHTALQDQAAMRETVKQLRKMYAGAPAGLASADVLRGELETRLGNYGAALRSYKQAQQLHPQEVILVRIAKVHEQLGDAAGAYHSYLKLCRLYGKKEHCEREP